MVSVFGPRIAGGAAGLLIAASLGVAPAMAQDGASIGADDFLEALQVLASALQTPKNPVLLGIGSGIVAPHGTVFVSVNGTTGRADLGTDTPDGSLAFGVGLGDATKTVGVQVTGTVSSLTDRGDAQALEAGAVGLKFSRAITASTFAGVAFDNVFGFGGEADEPVKTTLAVTHFRDVQIGSESYPLMLTAGYGTHVREFGEEPGVLLGAGMGITEHTGVSISTNTDYVNLGVGMKVPGVNGLSVSATLVDAFDQEDETVGQFAISYSFSDLF